MERKIKQWNGAPEMGGICRMSRDDLAKLAKRALKTDLAKSQVRKIVKEGFAPDGVECIRADDPKFAEYGAYSFKDIAVLLRYQENLLFSCERWKQ